MRVRTRKLLQAIIVGLVSPVLIWATAYASTGGLVCISNRTLVLVAITMGFITRVVGVFTHNWKNHDTA